MKTTCPHCRQRLSHPVAKEACTVACPTCGGAVRIAKHSSLPLALGLIVALVIFGFIFSAVIGGMEEDRQARDRMSSEVQRQSARWLDTAQGIGYGKRR